MTFSVFLDIRDYMEDIIGTGKSVRINKESYRGVHFDVIQTEKMLWFIVLHAETLTCKFHTKIEAYSYVHGYIDCMMDYSTGERSE